MLPEKYFEVYGLDTYRGPVSKLFKVPGAMSPFGKMFVRLGLRVRRRRHHGLGRGQRRGAGGEEVRAELVRLARVLVRHGRSGVIVGSEGRRRAPVDPELVEACAREL